MKREFLKKLGIEDEIIDDIMREHGKTVNRKEIDLENATQERDTLKKTLKEREAELTTLEKQSADTTTLQADLSALKEKYEAETKAHEEAMQKLTLDAEIKLALADKVHDIDIVLGQVDRDALKFADGKLTGLDDQIKQLQADKAFLFKNPETPSTPQPPNIKGKTLPGQGDTGATDPKPLNQMTYTELAAHYASQGEQ